MNRYDSRQSISILYSLKRNVSSTQKYSEFFFNIEPSCRLTFFNCPENLKNFEILNTAVLNLNAVSHIAEFQTFSSISVGQCIIFKWEFEPIIGKILFQHLRQFRLEYEAHVWRLILRRFRVKIKSKELWSRIRDKKVRLNYSWCDRDVTLVISPWLWYNFRDTLTMSRSLYIENYLLLNHFIDFVSDKRVIFFERGTAQRKPIFAWKHLSELFLHHMWPHDTIVNWSVILSLKCKWNEFLKYLLLVGALSLTNIVCRCNNLNDITIQSKRRI